MTFLTVERAKELADNAKRIATPGKGILAADESTGTIKKRFDNINVENTEANRAAYRNLLFKTTDLGKYVSGAILYEETLFQRNSQGTSMVELLHAEDIVPGIKVDKGLVSIGGTDDEKATQGLDGLAQRCVEYYNAGARFAKWRAVLSIDPASGKPSQLAINTAVTGLAQYAVICQENGLVPIVEPEILSDGAHGIEVCANVTEKVLAALFKSMNDHNVLLEGALLKPNMVTPGVDCPNKEDADTIAFFTVRSLRRTVPPALPGIMFLSGGQSEEESSINLNAINKIKAHPWIISFSYGRALQASCLKTWAGKTSNETAAQKVLLGRAEANSQAQLGLYSGGTGGDISSASLFEKKYIY